MHTANVVDRTTVIQKRPSALSVAATDGTDPNRSRQHDWGVNVTEGSSGGGNSVRSLGIDLVGIGGQFDKA